MKINSQYLYKRAVEPAKVNKKIEALFRLFSIKRFALFSFHSAAIFLLTIKLLFKNLFCMIIFAHKIYFNIIKRINGFSIINYSLKVFQLIEIYLFSVILFHYEAIPLLHK